MQVLNNYRLVKLLSDRKIIRKNNLPLQPFLENNFLHESQAGFHMQVELQGKSLNLISSFLKNHKMKVRVKNKLYDNLMRAWEYLSLRSSFIYYF